MVFCWAGSKLNVIGEKMQNGARKLWRSLLLVWSELFSAQQLAVKVDFLYIFITQCLQPSNSALCAALHHRAGLLQSVV